MASFLNNMQMNVPRYMALLEKLIGETERLQNNPAQGLIPQEDLAGDHVLEVLSPFDVKNGGVLEIERVSYVEGRGNLIIKYPGTTDKVCSFVGSHMDVVPADPAGWERDPFKLYVDPDGDTLYGRGTTDCLGHVAMITDFIATLAESKTVLKTGLVIIFIANEENGAFAGIGIDQLAKDNYMDCLKGGPLFWVDSADSQPCIGTAGNVQWELKIKGKLFHSGLPHKGINSIEMANDVTNEIQKRFYADFPQHPMEVVYKYATCSTMKPTQITCAVGSLNQIPPSCTVQGDIRLTPFYDMKDVKIAIEKYVAEINANPSAVENPAHGPYSHYDLPLEPRRGIVELKWLSPGENGVACDLESVGFKAICGATEAIIGKAEPFAINGSLPLIAELKATGFDVQISGYGLSSKYHADNESVSLKDMKQATRILSRIVAQLEDACE